LRLAAGDNQAPLRAGVDDIRFERIPRDFYPTPLAAVPPLIAHLRGIRTFAEPCAGNDDLVRHLESFRLRPAKATPRSTAMGKT
jgi:hypothetical protein